jgi:DNA-binding transcriptional regulator LsrR (DeoR family)
VGNLRPIPTEDFADLALANRPGATDPHAHFDLLARIASRYYLDEMTQGEIAAEFHLSRQKVQRLLHEARELRIVEIHVYAVPVLHLELEKKLKEVFGLTQALVAPTDSDEGRCRRSVTRAAAGYLQRYLRAGMVVTVGLGRNTSEVADALRPQQAIGCSFVSAMGGSPNMNVSVSPNEVCTRLAARTGGRARPLYAPAFVESAAVRDLLYAQEAVAQPLEVARHADVALMGIGTTLEDSILVRAACLSPMESAHLQTVGAVGEIIGNFFDGHGRLVETELNCRRVGLTLDELRCIPQVVAVAGEEGKACAIYGALSTGVIGVLVTECRNAIAVLRLAGVTDLKEEHRFLEHA